jgi:crotonobetainyl-CoA:carnitine CoA-transferase CaiB-like acyl-CoA transferase
MYRLPLFDHRILDLLDGPAAFAGRILGDMGAEVIKIEPPSGDSLRASDMFPALNVNKYSCTIDLSERSDLVLQLAALSDVVLAATGSIDPAALRAANDGLIVVLLPPGAGSASCTATAGAVGLALWDRRRTGKGGLIEMSPLTSGATVETAAPTLEPVSSMDAIAPVPTSALRMSETPPHVRLPAPTPGEHNDYVFRHLLGLSPSEIESLR